MLEVQAVSKAFRGIHAIEDVSFRIEPNSITSLIGPNGAGKTTMINVITGVLAPTRGALLFAGQPIAGRRPHQVASLGIRRTFQTVRLFDKLTVRENLTVGGYRQLSGRRWLHRFLPMNLGDAAGRRRADEVLAMFDLTALADEIATDLPYGTQRRVELARALMGRPRFALLDEPAAGMNEKETAQLVRDVRRIRDEGVTVLLVEHDMSMVMSVSDKVVVLNFGRKIAEGTPGEVQRNPDVIASYLGSDDA
ncbi:ABC transporter ATP-binding protein [Caballeronia sp. LZ035]|uniref:ABC transporter ATP-binding protein n=1 Tax=Caballeronia sp. LZ035 TaxID=3038568 RepID=UPI00285D4621|nr:ABC transporter ATP-binding protein [Caballeronia sp. LZ035]MDR5758619.1 ABC transporter ATP-binding protein [Caballeronia sp. LZ035]